MSDSALTSTLRERRAAAGFSQSELARQLGISRQALIAIEAGRQNPSTALALGLARALRCTVEDLFALPTGPRVEARYAGGESSTSRVVVGRVDGRWVAHDAPLDDRSADGLLVDGHRGDSSVVEPLCDVATLEHNVLVAGCAPLIGVLTERLGRQDRTARATWIPAANRRALDLLHRRLVHVAGIHLADVAEPDAHVRAARRALPGERATLINLARWRQGFVVARGNPLGIRSGGDLLRLDVRSVVREPGAGAQALFERVLAEAGSRPTDFEGEPRQAADHDEVARLVRWGVADVGVAIESAAIHEGLDFVPLSEERFDLVVPESRLDAPAVARLLDLVARPQFRAEAAGIRGYDLSLTGHASTVAAA